MQNKVEALNLYAKVEELLGVKEVAPKLYTYYFELLKEIEFDTLLDIGCGDGAFLSLLDSLGVASYTLGVDKSPLMVQRALERGVNATTKDLDKLNREFDVITAIFDMVNYLTPDELEEFFSRLSSVTKEGSYFIFDINSYYGLSELAVGNFIAQDEQRFVSIESFFEDNCYESYFTLFEKEQNGCYKKSAQQINQYYYPLEHFKNIKKWKVLKTIDIALYDQEHIDKHLIVMQKLK